MRLAPLTDGEEGGRPSDREGGRGSCEPAPCRDLPGRWRWHPQGVLKSWRRQRGLSAGPELLGGLHRGPQLCGGKEKLEVGRELARWACCTTGRPSVSEGEVAVPRAGARLGAPGGGGSWVDAPKGWGSPYFPEAAGPRRWLRPPQETRTCPSYQKTLWRSPKGHRVPFRILAARLVIRDKLQRPVGTRRWDRPPGQGKSGMMLSTPTASCVFLCM